jgi:predicted CXXCH cytochrome family protein
MAIARFWSVVLAALLLSAPCLAGDHPALSEAARCLDCHADKAGGTVVHPAILMGCESCHQLERKDETTRVSLARPLSSLCFRCHQEKSYTHQHFPYVGGMCTRCHDPHASPNSALLRASVNDLCLNCHLTQDSLVDPKQPMIQLNQSRTMGHPFERHPVSGKSDPLRGRDLDCTSCHLPHGSPRKHLMRIGVEAPGDVLNKTVETSDICAACHQLLPPAGEERVAKKSRHGKTH